MCSSSFVTWKKVDSFPRNSRFLFICSTVLSTKVLLFQPEKMSEDVNVSLVFHSLMPLYTM